MVINALFMFINTAFMFINTVFIFMNTIFRFINSVKALTLCLGYKHLLVFTKSLGGLECRQQKNPLYELNDIIISV